MRPGQFPFPVSALFTGMVCLAACDGRVESPTNLPPTEDGGTTLQPEGGRGAGPDAGSCSILDGVCAGAANCCSVLGGFRVDHARKCRDAVLTPLYCNPVPQLPGIKSCAVGEESSCVSRLSDAGTDADVETYVTVVNFGVPPGFSHCDESYNAFPVCP